MYTNTLKHTVSWVLILIEYTEMPEENMEEENFKIIFFLSFISFFLKFDSPITRHYLKNSYR